MSDKVPNLPNYENFMKATNKSTVFILAFMKFLMEMNRKKESEIHQGDFENIIFSYANIADCKIVEKLVEVVKGTIFADARYLQKKNVLKRMEEDGIKFEAAPNFRHFFYSISAYMINRNLDFYQNFFQITFNLENSNFRVNSSFRNLIQKIFTCVCPVYFVE